MKPFDYVNAVNASQDIIRASDNPELAEKNYNPWMTNKALSYFPDTVMFANEMNRSHHLGHLLQFDYFINTIRKKKRFSKWVKPDTADIEVIMEFYRVGPEKARQYLKVLTPEQLADLKARIIKGG